MYWFVHLGVITELNGWDASIRDILINIWHLSIKMIWLMELLHARVQRAAFPFLDKGK